MPFLRSGRWRGILAAVCITTAAVLVPLSVVTGWARIQLVDEDSFASTLGPLIDDPAVQDLLIDEAMDAITARVDFSELTGQIVDGIVDLGLGPRAASALVLLQQPVAVGLESLVADTVSTVVRSDAASGTWNTLLRGLHRVVATASTSDGAGVVVMTDDGLGIQLAPIVEQVRERLTDNGVGLASLIPPVDRIVIVGSGENVTALRTVYSLAVGVGWWMPALTVGLLGVGVALSRRRSVAVLGAGAGLVVGGAALGAALLLGANAVAQTAERRGLPVEAFDVIYRSLVESMRQTSWALAVIGLLLAVLGWMLGRARVDDGRTSASM